MEERRKREHVGEKNGQLRRREEGWCHVEWCGHSPRMILMVPVVPQTMVRKASEEERRLWSQ